MDLEKSDKYKYPNGIMMNSREPENSKLIQAKPECKILGP